MKERKQVDGLKNHEERVLVFELRGRKACDKYGS